MTISDLSQRAPLVFAGLLFASAYACYAVGAALLLESACEPIASTVLVCEADGQIVQPQDVEQGRHITERDINGGITLCGYVHPVRMGSGTAVGVVGDMR